MRRLTARAVQIGAGSGTLLATQAHAGDLKAAIKAPDSRTEDPTASAELEETSETEHTEKPAPAGPLFQDNPLVSLSGALREKQAELEKREVAVAAREKQLLALQAELDETLKKTKAMRDEMDKLAGAAETKRKQELGKWISIHETMKPTEAAQMLAEMDDDFSLELLAMMETRKSSKILGELVKTNKVKATALAHRLEEQNK